MQLFSQQFLYLCFLVFFYDRLADDPNSDLIEDETVTAQNETISENGVNGSHKSKHLPRDHETLTDPAVEDAADEKILVPVTKLPLSAATKPTTSTNEERCIIKIKELMSVTYSENFKDKFIKCV